jgi:surfeit locus 1 family protein
MNLPYANNARVMTMTENLKKHWFRHLLVLLVVIVLINLGLWQLRRLDQRRALNRDIETGLVQPPVVLGEADLNPETLHRRRVSLTGEFDNAAGMILRGRSLNGRPGAELVVPLLLAGSDEAVLVNRGWIPLDTTQAEARRIYDLEGKVTVAGIAYRSQPRPDAFFAPTDPTPRPGEERLDAWFRVDIDRIQGQVDYKLAPIFVEQSPLTEANTPPLAQEMTELSDGPHLGYAVQWFTFALILVVVYTVFIRQELKRERTYQE